MKFQLKCGSCVRPGRDAPKAVTLTEVEVETGEPQRGTEVRWRKTEDGATIHLPVRAYNAERNEADDGWRMTCSTGSGCGATYEVKDDELAEAVETAAGRKPPWVVVPHEVGQPVE